MKIKTIFFGSGLFAVPILNKLANLEFIDLCAIISQPDKPAGRKREIRPTDLAEFAEKHFGKSIDILKPAKIKDFAIEVIEKYQPELVIVASYGQIIPAVLINYPKYKCLNFHGSLLPILRGAIPIQKSILDGLNETGVTLQIMEESMDTGAIISSKKILIGELNSGELSYKLSFLGVEILEEDLLKWIQGQIIPIEQDESLATYCYKSEITNELIEIKNEYSKEYILRMIRAFNPDPIAFIRFNGKIIKIFNAIDSDVMFQDERSIKRFGKNLYLKASDGYLEIKELQLEGKKRNSAENYLFIENL